MKNWENVGRRISRICDTISSNKSERLVAKVAASRALSEVLKSFDDGYIEIMDKLDDEDEIKHDVSGEVEILTVDWKKLNDTIGK